MNSTTPKDDGGPAFPVECVWDQKTGTYTGGAQTGNRQGWATGLSVRDYFAAKALGGLICRSWSDESGQIPDDVFNRWAAAAYATADAMIEARKA